MADEETWSVRATRGALAPRRVRVLDGKTWTEVEERSVRRPAFLRGERPPARAVSPGSPARPSTGRSGSQA